MADLTKAYLKRHAAAEKRLAKTLGSFFDAQTKRIVRGIKDFDSPSPSIVTQLFDIDDEHELLMTTIAEPLLATMADGAADIISSRPKTKKNFDIDAAEYLDDFKLPQRVKDSIVGTFEELGEQAYWKELTETTGGFLESTLKTAIEEGIAPRKMAARVRQTMTGIARWRAAAIARTETTACFGAGHQASYNALADDPDSGLTGKKWLAIQDDDVRPEHSAADGQVVGPKEDFVIAGENARWPGDAGLSAGQRVNCRCTTVAVWEF